MGETIRNENEEALKVYDTADEIVTKDTLVSSFNKRSVYQGKFEEGIAALNAKRKQLALVLLKSKYFQVWLTDIFLGGYVIVAGMQVIDKSNPMSLGVFLGNLAGIGTACKAWGGIYFLVLDLQTLFPSMNIVLDFMNKPTDFRDEEMKEKYRRLTTTAKLEANIPADNISIMVHNLNRYSPQGRDITINLSGSFEIRQGELVALMGEHGIGKSTLLKLVGGSSLHLKSAADAECIYVPTHLRTLHVAREEIFFFDTLMANLTVGLRKGSPDAKPERVLSICRRIGLPEAVLRLIQSDDKKMWENVLSAAELRLLNLARAFITDYEFLVVHMPTGHFSKDIADKVMGLLLEFVRNRGVEHPADTVASRRPRTCLASTISHRMGRQFDRVLGMTETGITEIPSVEQIHHHVYPGSFFEEHPQAIS